MYRNGDLLYTIILKDHLKNIDKKIQFMYAFIEMRN